MRLPEFQKILQNKNIDLAIFLKADHDHNHPDILYFSQYPGAGALVIPGKNRPFLAVPKMEQSVAAKSGFKIIVPDERARLLEKIRAELRKQRVPIKRIGLNFSETTLAMKKALQKHLKKARFVDIGKELQELRMLKTPEEIKVIKKGFRIADSILKKAIAGFSAGSSVNSSGFRTEADVKAFLELEASKNGCSLAFPAIVASGKNASEVHHATAATKLTRGFCLIDFGIKYKNYCTDCSRTLFLGTPSKKDIERYSLVLKAQEDAIASIRKGMRCKSIYARAIKSLGKYARYFTHGLGHGVGIKIHELPNLTSQSKERFQNAQVFTVEPGIYFSDFGIRIEDTLLLINDKVEILTKLPKKLVVIRRFKWQ
ncbi:aminopeptidase P family protein [Candidatus Woesearchaeota archaeon]|nr:aminopeptidase P family protein [Candidatus Woesearchaeota archaeon]